MICKCSKTKYHLMHDNFKSNDEKWLIIQLRRPPFLHFMYYVDCKEIFPSPFNPRIHVRCFSRIQVTQEIYFEIVLYFRSFSKSLFFSINKKSIMCGSEPGLPAWQAGIIPLDHQANLIIGPTSQLIIQLFGLLAFSAG